MKHKQTLTVVVGVCFIFVGRPFTLYKLGVNQRALRPGVETYLQEAKKMGLKIGLASSSHRSWVDGYFQRFKLTHYFSCIRTADDVSEVKPNPELYLQTTAGLGADPSLSIAFEDSPTARVLQRQQGYIVSFDEYDLKLRSMDDIALTEVLLSLSENHGLQLG